MELLVARFSDGEVALVLAVVKVGMEWNFGS